ncbi:MAG: extracellular solute-binding protein [Anaerolineaceae bacterium]|nr:extracellular solute-binding protein [Anaerolineaceae bacterium]
MSLDTCHLKPITNIIIPLYSRGLLEKAYFVVKGGEITNIFFGNDQVKETIKLKKEEETMKKRLYLSMLILFLMVLLHACASQDVASDAGDDVASAIQEEDGKEEFIKLRFFAHRFTEQPAGNILLGQLAKYEELHPEIRIETITAPTGPHKAKLVSMCLAGDCPDVIFAARATGYYFPAGILADLEPYIEKEGGQTYKDKFPESVWPAVTDPSDGKWHAIPTETQWWPVSVNKGLAMKAGVELPKDGAWTWEEFLDAADKFQAAGVYAFAGYGFRDSSPMTLALGQWMLANGGTFWGLSEDCKEMDLATLENIKGISQWLYLGQNGYMPPGWVEAGGGDVLRIMAHEEAAMMVLSPNVAEIVKDESTNPDLEFVPVYLPGPGQKLSVFYESWAIGEGANYPDEAWELINWLNNDENVIERTTGQRTAPATLSILNQINDIDPKLGEYAALVDFEDASPACYEYLPNIGELKANAADALVRIANGEDIEVVLLELEVTLKSIYGFE